MFSAMRRETISKARKIIICLNVIRIMYTYICIHVYVYRYKKVKDLDQSMSTYNIVRVKFGFRNGLIFNLAKQILITDLHIYINL